MKCLNFMVIYKYIGPGWGRLALGVQPFSESLIFSPNAHFLQGFPLNDTLTVFPFEMLMRPKLTSPLNRSRSSQVHAL